MGAMKKLFVSTLLILTLVGFAASRAQAYSYYHDDKYWYDSHHQRHAFVVHNHHHGYWDNDKGVKVFVNID